jgi:cobalt-zinc-cadmium efflux system outer membrane protein
MHTYKLLLTVLLILYAPLAHADPAGKLQLTSQDAVALALNKNKSFLAARTAIDEASAYSKYAGKLDNPELKLGYASDRAFNDEGEQVYSIGVEQRFPITNRLKLLKNVSAMEVKLAEAELRNQRRLLVRDVEISVDRISSLDERLTLLTEVIELQDSFTTFLEKRIENGEASTLDLNQVRVTLFSVKQDIQQLNKQRHEGLGSLRSLLGVEPTVEIEIVPESSAIESLPVMPALSLELLQWHPEYQFKALLAEMAQKQTVLAEAERWADIAIEIFFEEERAVDEPTGLGRDRFFGIGVSIPLPIHDSNRGKVEGGRIREKKVHQEMSSLRLRLQNEADTLRRNAEATYRQAATYKEGAVNLVEQNLEDINHAYASGLVDLGEVFRVQEQRLTIKTAQLELWHELKQILIEWEAATARNLSNISTGDLSDETN